MVLPSTSKIMNNSTYLHHLTALASLFSPGFNWIEAENLPKPNWRTNNHFPLHLAAFVTRYSDELSLIGVSFGNTTSYGMLDIDRGSQYHPDNNPQAFARLLATLEKIGLIEPIVIRSSHSEGIHIYYFFPHPLPTFRVASYLKVKLIDAGYKIENGQLEIFPNTKAYSTKDNPTHYKAHRLPLQPNSGSILLDNEARPLCTLDNANHQNMVAAFLRFAEQSAARNDINKIEQKLDHCYARYRQDIAKYQRLGQKHSEIAHTWSKDLQLRLAIGWTANGQTNEILPKFVAYGIVFLQIADKQELSEWIKTTILNTPGYREYCRHQHEIERIINGWVNKTIDSQYYVKYCGFPERSGVSIASITKQAIDRERQPNQHNIKQAKIAQAKLSQIVKSLTNIPSKTKELIRVIQAKSQELFGTKISRDTLYRPENKTIWQQPQNSEKASDPALTKNQPQTQPPQDIQPQNIQSTVKTSNASTPDIQTRSCPKSLYETCNLQPPAGGSVPIDGDSNLDLIEPQSTQIPAVKDSGVESERSSTPENLDLLQTVQQIEDLKVDPNSEPEAIDPSILNSSFLTLHSEYISNTDGLNPPAAPKKFISETYQSHIEDVEPAPLPTPHSPLSIGTRLKRNPQRAYGKNYPALPHCEVIGRNGLDWQVRSPSGALLNVSSYAIEHGDWEVEPEESFESSESNRSLSTVNCQLSTDLLVGATVRTITGLIGVIKHIFPAHLMDKSIVVLIGEARLRFAVDELRLE
jgi:hypothetical protein